MQRRIVASLLFSLLAGSLCLSASAQTAFTASFVDSHYRFNPSINALTEGAGRLKELGATAINIYVDTRYYDNGTMPSEQWGPQPPNATTLQLLQEPLFFNVISDPQFTIVSLTTYDAEQLQDLTVWLRNTFAGTGKTFIIKNWEGDYNLMPDPCMPAASTTLNPPLHDYTQPNVCGGTPAGQTYHGIEFWLWWWRLRQDAVARGRDATPDSDVQVYHAVEVRFAMLAEKGFLIRLANLIPYIAPDMVAYSSYESVNDCGPDYTTVYTTLSNSLSFLGNYAAQLQAVNNTHVTPGGPTYAQALAADNYSPRIANGSLPANRIAITEFGVDQARTPAGYSGPRTDDEVQTRIRATVQAAKDKQVLYAVWWHIYDNECWQNPATNITCNGWWLIRPDGTRSAALQALMPVAGWSCTNIATNLHTTSTSQPYTNAFKWGATDNNLVWSGSLWATDYVSTVSPADTGTGVADNYNSSWYTVYPTAAVGTYSWNVQAKGLMCDTVTLGSAFMILPPWPVGTILTSAYSSTAFYLDDTSAELSWNAISLPPGAYYELTLITPTGTVVKNLGTATSVSLYPTAGLGNYSYTLRTRVGNYSSAGPSYNPNIGTGTYTVLDPARRRACC